MIRLHRDSERYAASGGISADGAKNTLGRPQLELPELFVRETLQNACDAYDPSSGGRVAFSIETRALTSDEHSVLQTLFEDTPPKGLPLESSLRKKELRVLVLADRGTTGLGGPTRADITTTGGTTDFVDLLRNVGQPRDKEFGAGTYGYGKSVLFRASSCSTILVHTRCQTDGGPESRLLAAALGHNYDDDGRRMTGRHWWGVSDAEVGAEPVLGSDADRIAEQLGLPPIEGTGTTIVVIDPDLGVEDPVRLATRIVDAALLYAWPRLASIDGLPGLELSVSVDGSPMTVPDPATVPYLEPFVSALLKVRNGQGETLRSQRPRQDLGTIAFDTCLLPQASSTPTDVADDEPHGISAEFPDGVHHVALMRHPHLVVKYMPGPAHPVSHASWGGVFVVETAVDQAFSDAEPPTHDDWNPELLEPRSWDRRYVQIAKRRIEEAMREFTAAAQPTPPSAVSSPLGQLADRLSDLMPATIGPRLGGGTRQASSRSAASSRARVNIGRRRLTMTPQGPAVIVEFTVTHARGTSSTTVDASAGLAVDDGTAYQPGEIQPIGWTSADGSAHPAGPVSIDDTDTWMVTIPQAEGLALVVDIRPLQGAEE